MSNRQVKRDAKSLAVITGAAVLGMAATAGLLLSNSNSHSQRHVVEHLHVVETGLTSNPTYETVTPLSGVNRLFGRVSTRGGDEFVGFIRWDRNEGSWSDLLDANKLSDRGRATQAGIRFGHIERIEPVGHDGARFLLKSGEVVDMGARASDLGSGLRALQIDGIDGQIVSLEWHDLDAVEFLPTPLATRPAEGRLFGTLRSGSGAEFTGFVTWDVDEIYSSDILDGDLDGERQRIPFGAIESIHQHGGGAARVVLHDGREMVLRGTNDVNRSNSGISVSDPGLGQIKVDWSEFVDVRFHGAEFEAGYDDFDGGTPLFGTVVTEDGDELTGEIAWDRDESRSWEMLNGDADGIEFQVELGNVERIRKLSTGSEVLLQDGRRFELHGSNDVDADNRGIVVQAGSDRFVISWDEFKELRLQR